MYWKITEYHYIIKTYVVIKLQNIQSPISMLINWIILKDLIPN